MRIATRAGLALLLCLPLTGCYVKTYGVQSSGKGQASTATSTQVSGSTQFSGGRASFSSGQVPSSNAPGGHASLSRSGSGVLVVGVVITDFLSYVAGYGPPKSLPADTKILETCSCYMKEVTSDK